MLIHVTQQVRVVLIRRDGLLSPADAESRGHRPVFGSGGSNRSVVQLLDCRHHDHRIVRENVETLIDGTIHNGARVERADVCALVLDESIRDDPRFVSPDVVAFKSRPTTSIEPTFRHMASIEAWFKGTIAPSYIQEAIELTELWRRLSDRARSAR
jgi:hypothetical protein